MAKTVARGIINGAALIGAVSVLTGCGVSTLTQSFSGVFGGNKTEAAATVPESNPLTTAQNSPSPQNSPTPQVDGAALGSECPAVAISPGDASITFLAKGVPSNDGLGVLHRGEITKTARECSASISGGLSVKFGFAGRVLLGPQGKPGIVNLPIKITVMDKGRTTLKSESVKLPVTVGINQTSGDFSVVREVIVPMPAGASAKDYRIFVAFDRKAPGAS